MKKWNDLPEIMKTPAVKEYYEILQKKKISLALKRLFDIVVSFIMLSILLPVFLFLGIWIKLDSKGPVFFRQVRVTRYGKQFKIFKFRTMVNDADKVGTLVTVGEDSRITRAGAKLRRLRLDELPQLINVLIGDMSFVGTRPEVVKYVNSYTDEMNATLLLPAGITSEASIRYKDEDKILTGVEDVDKTYIDKVLPAKMEYNLRSIREFSFVGDILTMFRTVGAVFFRT